MNTFTVGDVAEIVYLDISTANIGEYTHVRVIDTDGDDILVQDAYGRQAWVTPDHLEKVTD